MTCCIVSYKRCDKWTIWRFTSIPREVENIALTVQLSQYMEEYLTLSKMTRLWRADNYKQNQNLNVYEDDTLSC